MRLTHLDRGLEGQGNTEISMMGTLGGKTPLFTAFFLDPYLTSRSEAPC